ncbi:MAG: GvpL/GvpF family gas vesicle protein [Syntrophaceae bacterium]|nr:GvpL/GvpF family gas vesicle protein [Syntrophaceae bacterium]
MKLLLYCVMRANHSRNLPHKKGIQDQNLMVVGHREVTAIVSNYNPNECALDVDTLLKYHHVIEGCFRHGTVIPFRFKTFLNDEKEVETHLEQHGMDYEETLTRLDEKVEMGIRVIMERIGPEGDGSISEEGLSFDTIRPGKSYLDRRRHVYKNEGALDSRLQAVVSYIKEALNGFYVDFKIDSVKKVSSRATDKNLLISMYFLINKSSLGMFQSIVDQMKAQLGRSILLSGPWAPYNFVVSENPHSVSSLG